MSFFKNLFGGEKGRPAAAAASGSGPQSLANELEAALLQDIPSHWTAFRSQELKLEIPFPASWTLAEQRESIVIRPAGGRTLTEAGNFMFSPGFTFMAGGGASVSDDALLDAYANSMASSFQGFRRRESGKVTLDGVRTLAVFFDFERPSGTWSCLLTMRVKGSSFWYLDASGHGQDMASLRPELVPVLANLRLYSSEAAFDAAAARSCPAPIQDTLPEGNSIGLLFEIASCSDGSYGRAFEGDFFGRLDMRRLAGAQVFVGDILPECLYYCIRVDGPSDVVRYIRDVFTHVTDVAGLPAGGHRFMSGASLQRAPLVLKGYVDEGGRLI